MQVDPAHMTIEEARQFAGIKFEHAWWMVTTGRWNVVRCTFLDGQNIIRVWREQVEQSVAVWAEQDQSMRARYREMAKASRRARKSVRAAA